MDHIEKPRKYHRYERMAIMTHIFSQAPGKLFTLSSFGEEFNAAKSTMSEDVSLLSGIFKEMEIGTLETLPGATGGVSFHPAISKENACQFVSELCSEIVSSDRLLPGGYFYLNDILTKPDIVKKMGMILAGEFKEANIDFVLTVETKGIPVALMTADALGVPLVIARRSSSFLDGSAVNINYVTSSDGIKTMTLSRRAVKEGQRALIVDDVLKAGGTAKGMMDLMKEFKVDVVGCAFVISRAEPVEKLISGEKSLMTMYGNSADTLRLEPADWLQK